MAIGDKLIITDKLINIGKLIITEKSPLRFPILNFTPFGQGMEITGTIIFMPCIMNATALTSTKHASSR